MMIQSRPSTEPSPTDRVEVSAVAHYVPERSQPSRQVYFFAYRVRIRNTGGTPCRLLSRHWLITDSTGRVEEVRGLGVVGEQPLLQPNDVFEYTSACPLRTAVGTMRGTYEMMSEAGERFEAVIPPFELAAEAALN
jgi:ApaG protein